MRSLRKELDQFWSSSPWIVITVVAVAFMEVILVGGCRKDTSRSGYLSVAGNSSKQNSTSEQNPSRLLSTPYFADYLSATSLQCPRGGFQVVLQRRVASDQQLEKQSPTLVSCFGNPTDTSAIEINWQSSPDEMRRLTAASAVFDADTTALKSDLEKAAVVDWCKVDEVAIKETLRSLKNRQNFGSSNGTLLSCADMMVKLAKKTTLTLLPAAPINLAPLRQMTNMRNLSITTDNAGVVVRGVGDLEQVQSLELDSVGINGEELSRLPHLRSLRMVSLRLPSVTPLAELFQLQELFLNKNELVSISELKNLKNLRQIDLSNNRITDIMSLLLLENPSFLDLSNNPVENYLPFLALIKDRHIEVRLEKRTRDIKFLK